MPPKTKAQRGNVTLPDDLKPRAIARAESLGLVFASYVAALIRNDLLRPNKDLRIVCDAPKKPRPKV